MEMRCKWIMFWLLKETQAVVSSRWVGQAPNGEWWEPHPLIGK